MRAFRIQRVLAGGDPAQAILDAAQIEKANLIMMPSHGYTFDQFLLGSEAAQTRNRTECPVWTGAYAEGSLSSSSSLTQEFAIRSVLCAVKFTPHSEKAVSWASRIAAEFGARLTLAHATCDMGIWAPGGAYVNPKLKSELVTDASRQMLELQQSMGIKAETFIGSGDVPKVLSQAAEQTKADLLVNECYPYGGNLRIHGFGVICAVPIPVLSV